jgi:hypothetical protein
MVALVGQDERKVDPLLQPAPAYIFPIFSMTSLLR